MSTALQFPCTKLILLPIWVSEEPYWTLLSLDVNGEDQTDDKIQYILVNENIWILVVFLLNIIPGVVISDILLIF